MQTMDKRARLLYAEDDETLSFVTIDNLELRGYGVDHCTDGITAMEKAASGTYDLCILDVMLPRMDGFSLARKIREKNDKIPIIFLTALSAKGDKIHGLSIGGDDYITKPYSIEELVLKIEIFLKWSRIRVPEGTGKELINLGKLVFDPLNQLLSHGEHRQTLTHKESGLLQILASRNGSVIKREELLMTVWGNDQFYSSRSLDVFISRLRKFIAADPGLKIENIHNVGYRLTIAKKD
jgi:two-component system, OmpR family, response regulator VicR